MTIEVLVKPAARDPWSFTVEEALRRKLGIGSLAGVERLKSWQLDFGPAGEEDSLAVTGKILDETALLANPNRDLWVVRGPSRGEVPESFLGGNGGHGDTFAVRVADREDIVGRSIHTVLARRLRAEVVRAVRYSLVWILSFETGEADSAGLAGRIAVARSWRKGLLANPHSQEATVQAIRDFAGKGGGFS